VITIHPSPAAVAADRSAITAIVVPMLQGAAVHTAVVAEQLAASEDS